MTLQLRQTIILALSLVLGFWLLGSSIAGGMVKFKSFERSITVKGLSEREYPADIVIWPVKFSVASNNLGDLYTQMERSADKIKLFLIDKGVEATAVSIAAPTITDKSAHQYGRERPPFRYVAQQTVTVYSANIDKVRSVMGAISELGKQGIVISGDHYQSQVSYLFTRLNAVKPEMIEEATRNARQVAKKFAQDSKSKLGKIKRARQGQFSISERDSNNPHLKKVRVVSTIEYYLSD